MIKIRNSFYWQNPPNYTEQKNAGSQVWTAGQALLVATGEVVKAHT